MGTQLTIGIVILVSAAGFLVYESFATAGPPHVFVEDLELLAKQLTGPDASTQVSLHGKVVPGSIRPAENGVAFEIRGEKGGVQEVFFKGTKPDGLQDDRDVSIRGTFKGDRSLIADQLETKCPSKYEGMQQGG